MRYYVIVRLLQIIPTFLTIVIAIFFLTRMAPGDPVTYIAGDLVDPTYRKLLVVKFGLDKPWSEQLYLYLAALFRGDLGYSFVWNTPVLTLILGRVPATVLLLGTGMGISYILGIFLGVVSSRRPYSITDNLVTTISLAGYAVPGFWMGMLLIIVFSLYLNLFPSQGMVDVRVNATGIAYIADILRHLTLPAVSFSFFELAVASRLTRSGMLEVMRLDYVTTARAKGVPERVILYKHCLRNAIIPIVTVLGTRIGRILTGSVLIETVFAWPGIGRLLYDAIVARDYPVITGLFVIVSLMVIIANFAADLVCAYLDPRMKYVKE